LDISIGPALTYTHPLDTAMSTTTSTWNWRTDNLGPLTTVFTPPSTCLETTTCDAPCNQVAGFEVGAFWDDVSACYPTGTKSLDLHTLPYYWSPGICPSGWAPYQSIGTGVPVTVSGYDTGMLPSSVTAWLCCPSYVVTPTAPRCACFTSHTDPMSVTEDLELGTRAAANSGTIPSTVRRQFLQEKL